MKLRVVDHPLIQHKLTLLRLKATSPKGFRDILDEISTLMAFEVTRGIPTEPVRIRTPLAGMVGRQIASNRLAVVAILRAGLGMIGGILKLAPGVSVGHLGLYRNESTLLPVEYYRKLPPDIAKRFVILVDPMLATGHSADEALRILKSVGVKKIVLMTLISAPEGVRLIQKNHSDVEIFTAALDKKLNPQGYIVPGLGDAGDRLFGTA